MNRIWRVAVAFCLCLAFACACRGQGSPAKGQIEIGNGNGSGGLTPVFPFTCNVDGTVFVHLSDCVGFMGAGSAQLPALITSNTPEYITTTANGGTGLPWDPGTFTGTVQLGKGGTNSPSTTCSSTMLDCWVTDVPIIIGSHMTLAGSGGVAGGASFSTGTAITPGPNFPAPLGQPGQPTLMCESGGDPGVTLNLTVGIVEVNNLNTAANSTFAVPGFSAESPTNTIGACPTGDKLRVFAPNPGTGAFGAKDFRVFATTGLAGSETLQFVDGVNFKCSAGSGSVDPTYACSLGSGGAFADIFQDIGGGDSPNLVDLSNPLVVETGPVPTMQVGTTKAQNEAFWSLLTDLTLTLPASTGTNNPNVAFWNPAGQENSGLDFVGFTGVTNNMTVTETGAWIYIGNHAPNSFVSNVQTDTNPTMGKFYGMILDGGGGFGTALGTARIVENSTFTPGQGGGQPMIQAATLVTGSNAAVDFVDDHFEGSAMVDCIEVVTGASASAQGNLQSCNPFIHLRSASNSPSGVAGTDIAARNVSTASGAVVVQDDVNNNLKLLAHVSDYSTAAVAGSVADAGLASSALVATAVATTPPSLQSLPAGMSGQALTSTGSGSLPAFAALNLAGANVVTNTLPVGNGGSGTATASANTLFAGPTSGSAAAPAFRAQVAADEPNWCSSGGLCGFWGVTISLPTGPPGSVTSPPMASQAHVYQFELPFKATVSHITGWIATGVSGATCDLGIYDATGSSGSVGNLLVHLGGVACSTSAVSISGTTSTTTLNPGTYWLAACSSSTSVAFGGFDTNTTFLTVENKVAPRVGLIGSACSSGVLQTGPLTVTAGATVTNIALGFFEP